MRKFNAFFLTTLVYTSQVFAVSGTWQGGTGGNWSNTNKWVGGAVADGAGDTAGFPETSGNQKDIDTVTDRTLGHITFSDNNRYTLENNTINLNNNGSAATITSTDNHRIQSRIHLVDVVEITTNNPNQLKLQGIISGDNTTATTVEIKKLGAAELFLQAPNTYVGTTQISAGTLVYDSVGAIKDCNIVVIDSGATLRFDTGMGATALFMNMAAGATIEQNDNPLHFKDFQSNGSLILSGHKLCELENIVDTTFSGVISGGVVFDSSNPTGGARIIKSGAGKLTLNGASTHVSRIFIQDGKLVAASPGALGAPSDIDPGSRKGSVFIYNGAHLDIASPLTLSKQIRSNGLLSTHTGDVTINLPYTSGWSASGVTASPSTISVTMGNKLTLSSIVQGSEKLIKTGAGTLVLGGTDANTLSGTICVIDGILCLNKSGAALDKAIVANAEVSGTGILKLQSNNQISETSTVTICSSTASFDMNARTDTIGKLVFKAGLITNTNTNGLILNDSGTPLTMHGGTTIPGKVKFPNGGMIHFNSISGAIATLTDAEFGMPVTFCIEDGTALVDLAITGTTTGSTFMKMGLGTLRLAGAHSHPGSSTLATGTTEISGTFTGDAALSIGKLDLQAGGSFIGNIAQTSGTFCNAGTQTGNLTQTGGTSTITGIQTGNLSVGPGTTILTAPGVITGSVDVNGGGLFRGNGTFGAGSTLNINAGGVLEPGQSIGTMTINGAACFNAGSTYLVEFNAQLLDFNNDLLLVQGFPGTATIKPGAAICVTPDIGSPPQNPLTTFDVTLIEAIGGVSGTFDTVKIDAALMNASLDYTDPNKVRLTLNIVPFGTLFGSGNPGQVAEHLDSINPPLNSDLGAIISLLQMLPEDQLRPALNELHPSLLRSMPLSQQNNAIRNRGMITRRLSDMYRRLCKCDDAHKRLATVWGDVAYDWYDQKGFGDERGFDTTSWHFGFGMDHVNDDNFLFGLNGAFCLSDVDWDLQGSSGEIQSGYLGMYASKYWKYLYMNAALQTHIAHFKHKRSIEFATIDRQAQARYYGQGALAHAAIGHIWLIGRWEWKPFAQVDYTYFHRDSYRERGAGDVDLLVKHADYHLLRTEAGLNITHCMDADEVKVIADAKFSYVREDRLGGNSYKAAFQIVPDHIMKIRGLNPDHNMFSPAISVTFMSPCEKYFFRLGYEGEIAHKHIAHHGHLKAGLDF